MRESARALFAAVAAWLSSWLASTGSILPVVSPHRENRNIGEKPFTHYYIPNIFTATRSTDAPVFSAILNSSQLLWLALYFLANLCLTLHNKFVLVRFPYPYTLTALHTLCGTIGTHILCTRGFFEPRRLLFEEHAIVFAFSILYTVNVAVSNLSLRLVTIPFHQVVRAATPIFVMIISYAFLRKRYSAIKIISVVPVTVGVGFATFGDYYFTTWGFCLTLFGTLLAALKTVVTNILQSPTPLSLSPPSRLTSFIFPHNATRACFRLQLHPLDLLARMSPIAFIQCVTIAALSGELIHVRAAFVAASSSSSNATTRVLALAMNGVLAFLLNVVSFSANRKCGALSMTVAANVKQVLTIVFAVVLFDLTITPVNALGIGLTLLGGAWYAREEYVEKQAQRKLLGKRATKESASASFAS